MCLCPQSVELCARKLHTAVTPCRDPVCVLPVNWKFMDAYSPAHIQHQCIRGIPTLRCTKPGKFGAGLQCTSDHPLLKVMSSKGKSVNSNSGLKLSDVCMEAVIGMV